MSSNGIHLQSPVIAETPSFLISSLIQAVTQRADQYCDHDDLLDLSPLTTPESSPCASPIITTIALNNEHDCEPPSINSAPPTDHVPRIGTKEKRKAAKKEKSRLNRRKRRALDKEGAPSVQPRPEAEKKYLFAHAPAFSSNDTATGRTTKGSYIAGRSPYDGDPKLYSLEELTGSDPQLRFRLVDWDGITPKPIVDSEGRVIGVLAGSPVDGQWGRLMGEAERLLQDAAMQRKQHGAIGTGISRRGEFMSLRSGISHGGGQLQPGNLCNGPIDEALIQTLNASEPFQRLAGFSSCEPRTPLRQVFTEFATAVFASWAPKLHQYYQTTKLKLCAHYPKLQWPFPGGVFSAVSYNLGPATVCLPHTDFANLPFGWCSITALGNYDYTKGGHLVLWDCGLVIQFPPGSTILIPSALIAHSNTTIASNETRYSFTQYTAGGIFRWVDFGFKTKAAYISSQTKGNLPRVLENLDRRWSWGLSLFRILPGFKPQ